MSTNIINSFEFANEQQLLMNVIFVQVASQGMKSARVNRRPCVVIGLTNGVVIGLTNGVVIGLINGVVIGLINGVVIGLTSESQVIRNSHGTRLNLQILKR
jgi:hypothetical protein